MTARLTSVTLSEPALTNLARHLNVLRALAKQNPCPETLTELNGFYDALRIGGFKDGIVRLATEMRDASV